jgi:hypothetical protein
MNIVIPAKAGIHHPSWSFTANSLGLAASGDGLVEDRMGLQMMRGQTRYTTFHSFAGMTKLLYKLTM